MKSFFKKCFIFFWKLNKSIKSYFDLLVYLILFFLYGPESSFNFLKFVESKSTILILKFFGASIGKSVEIQTGTVFHNAFTFKNLSIGNNCKIGKNCFFDLRGKINIQNNVVVSMGVSFITHQDLNGSILSIKYPSLIGDINLEDDSYVGANSTILSGVTVAEQSIIAAGSLLNKNSTKGYIYAGIPATKKKII